MPAEELIYQTPIFPHYFLMTSRSILGLAILHFAISCVTSPESPTPTERASFASIKPILETNCVHCHGENHLAHMPPFGNSRELASLVGSGKWISPGHPEDSRFLQVVTLNDTQPGAMPPTGHALSKDDTNQLRAWIASGAPIPKDAVTSFIPKGSPPRSR